MQSDNLEKLSSKPIFQSIFGPDWKQLPPVFKLHYANRPNCADQVVVRGIMAIKMSKLLQFLSPIFRLTQTLVPKPGENIEVTVKFKSRPNSDMFFFERIFRFSDGDVWKFYSRMEPIGGNQIVEWTRSGVGWRASIVYKDEQILLRHQGYCIKVFGKLFPLPLGLILGYGQACERVDSSNSFEMKMTIDHPWWGNVYRYEGRFDVIGIDLDG